MPFLSWMKERSASRQDAAQRSEPSWQKALKEEQYTPVAQMSESEKVRAREIGEQFNRATQHPNAGGRCRPSLAEEAGCGGPQRQNHAGQDRQAAPFTPTDGNAGKAALGPVNTPSHKAPEKAPSETGATWLAVTRATQLEALSGAMVLQQETGFKLHAQVGNDGGRRIDWAISPAGQASESGELAPGARDKGKSILGGRTLEIRQEDALGFRRWPDCHKTVTFKDAVCMVQRKGHTPSIFASENPALRRGQRRPKWNLGETYAVVIFFTLLGCMTLGSVLLGLASAAPNQSIRRTHAKSHGQHIFERR